MMKVSILMSVYNDESYLAEAIESILEQTFCEFEFILLDDASTDNSSKILQQYANQDSRIILIRNPENLGLVRSLNKGLSIAQGQYIARQDADDISLPKRLERQTAFLDQNPEVGALGTAVKLISKGDQIRRVDFLPKDHESLQAYLLLGNQLHHSSMMMRHTILQGLEGYDEDRLHAEDYDLWWRISRCSRLATIPEILVIRREGDRPTVSSKYRQPQLEMSLNIALNAVQEYIDTQTSQLDQDAYCRLWWAYLRLLDGRSYRRFYLSQYGKEAELRREHIQQLQPFWQLLVDHPGGISALGNPLCKLGYSLLEYGQTLAGLQLLWIVRQQFNIRIQWGKLFKTIVKPYVPSRNN